MVPRTTVVFAAVLLAASAGSAAAQAQQPKSLREAFGAPPGQGRAAPAPPVSRFVAGESAFILDRSGRVPLLKFEDDREIWALRPTPGPRGDVIYKDDLGRPVLRSTRLGGVTVFTPERPSGLPAAAAGPAAALRPAAVTAVKFLHHIVRQGLRVSQAVGRQVIFEVPEVDVQSTGIYADAATLTADTLVRNAEKMTGGALVRVNRVEFVEGPRSSVAITGVAITITVAPEQGLAGRPSSDRVLTALDAAH